jgi:hypothetical protein
MNSDCLIGQVPDAKHTAIFKAIFSHHIIAGVRESHSNAIEQVTLLAGDALVTEWCRCGLNVKPILNYLPPVVPDPSFRGGRTPQCQVGGHRFYTCRTELGPQHRDQLPRATRHGGGASFTLVLVTSSDCMTENEQRLFNWSGA